MNENEYIHNTRDVSDRFRIYVYLNEYIFETGKIGLLYGEDIHSHSYFFYICQQEYGPYIVVYFKASLTSGTIIITREYIT